MIILRTNGTPLALCPFRVAGAGAASEQQPFWQSRSSPVLGSVYLRPSGSGATSPPDESKSGQIMRFLVNFH